MKDGLISLTLIVLILMTAVGCSAVRVMQTQAGVAAEKVASTAEERKTQLNKRDFRLGFGATENQLGIRLEYRPYYNLERRQLVTYKPAKGGRPLELLIALAEIGLLIWTLSDVLVETGEVAVNDEGELYNVSEFDWDNASPLQIASVAGVSLDALLWLYYATEYKATVHEPWGKIGEITGDWHLLRNHPYRIELPSYNFRKDYLSESGNERIQVSEFLSGVDNPIKFREIDSVLLRTITEFDGKAYQKTLNFNTQSQLQPFHDIALTALDIDMISTGKPRLMPRPEVVALWSETSVQAGDVATLGITVENTGKGTLYRFTARTVSPNPIFNNHELKFGKIVPGESKTVPVSFELDALLRTQEIPIRFKFAEYNNYVPENIEARLKVIEMPRPKFEYTYHIIDGGTTTSVGNRDGILQRGESADISVTVKNVGKGDAVGVTARLNLLNQVGVDMYGDTISNLHNLAPGDSKTATFNVGIKRGVSISKLRLNLLVQENNFGSETKLTETLDVPIGRAIVESPQEVHALLILLGNDKDIRASVEQNEGYMKHLLRRVSEHANVHLTVMTSKDEVTGEVITMKLSGGDTSDIESKKQGLIKGYQVNDWLNNLRTGQQDTVLIYYNGHGEMREFDNNHIFNFDQQADDKISRTALRAQLERKPGRLKMLITDTCSNRVGTPELALKSTTNFAIAIPRNMTYPKNLFLQHKGILDITAVQPGHYAWGDSDIGGYFTAGLIQSIIDESDTNQDRFLTWQEVFKTTQLRTDEIFKEKDFQQSDALRMRKADQRTQKPFKYSLPTRANNSTKQ